SGATRSGDGSSTGKTQKAANDPRTARESPRPPQPPPLRDSRPRLPEAALLGPQPAAAAALAIERPVILLAAGEALHHEGRRLCGLRREHARGPCGRLVVGIVDAQAPAPQLEGVEATDGVGRTRGVTELGEREAARAACHAVLAEPDADAGIDLGEYGVEFFFGGVEGQIADENRGRNGRLLLGSSSTHASSLYGHTRPLKEGTAEHHARGPFLFRSACRTGGVSRRRRPLQAPLRVPVLRPRGRVRREHAGDPPTPSPRARRA